MRYPIFQALWLIGLLWLGPSVHAQAAEAAAQVSAEASAQLPAEVSAQPPEAAASVTTQVASAGLGTSPSIQPMPSPPVTRPPFTQVPGALLPATELPGALLPVTQLPGALLPATQLPAPQLHNPLLPPAQREPPLTSTQPGIPPLAPAPRPRPIAAIRPVPLSLEAGTGRIVTLDTPAESVFAADPRVADVRAASPNALFILGVGAGHTTIAAIDAAGIPIAQYDVIVQPSSFAASQAQATIARLLPGSGIRVSSRPSGLVVEGSLQTPAEAEQALQAARDFAPAGQSVESRLSVASSVQVNLRVRIAEVSRSVIRQLGINWTGFAELGRYAAIGIATANPLANATVPASVIGAGYAFNTPGHTVDINALIDAMAQDQLVHVLAEPNLTATSGQTASFLVGGEFPIPVAQQNNEVTIEFKQYGISLAFIPTVLSAGRINMKVRPEVSQLTNVGAIRLSVGNSSIQVPALTVRRAETTVELSSGQSFAIAGLLSDSATQTGNALPGIGELPILGALFRSDSFQRNETELVIVITPYLVNGVAKPTQVKLPTDGWRPPTDLERLLLLRQTTRGGGAGGAPPHIPGDAGFVVQ